MLHSLVKLNVSITRDSADTGGEKSHGMSENRRSKDKMMIGQMSNSEIFNMKIRRCFWVLLIKENENNVKDS